ncbi:hypothetical protein [Nocardia sp. IFM 10818]
MDVEIFTSIDIGETRSAAGSIPISVLPLPARAEMRFAKTALGFQPRTALRDHPGEPPFPLSAEPRMVDDGLADLEKRPDLIAPAELDRCPSSMPSAWPGRWPASHSFRSCSCADRP